MAKTASNADGYLLLHKKSGLTSFDSLFQVKKALHTGKVGHTGTLDKFAEGLLVLLVGRYTSLVPLFNDLDKVYTGTLYFGQETDTLDPEGSIVTEAALPDADTVFRVLRTFIGEQWQIPPEYSAIHVDGQRAYERVRSGESLEMKPRYITIYSIKALNFDGLRLTFMVHCSKGTYIRALARDIGRAAGSCAYLEKLSRIAVGPFEVGESITPKAGEAGYTDIQAALKPVKMELFNRLGIPVLMLEDTDCISIIQGKPLEPLLKRYDLAQGGPLLGLFNKQEVLVALIECIQDRWFYKHVYSPH